MSCLLGSALSRRAVLAGAAAGTLAGAVRPPEHAGAQSATPVPTERVELVSVTFPAGALPPGDLQVEVRIYDYAPGSSDSTYGNTLNRGVGAVRVLTGEWGVSGNGPLVVLRAPDGHAEAVPTGTEVTLGAGDTLVYPRVEVQRARRAIGDAPVSAVGIFLLGNETPAVGDATPGTGNITNIALSGLSLTGEERNVAGLDGEVTVTLARATVAQGDALPPQTDPSYTVRFVEQGKATWGLVTSDSATPAALKAAFKGSAIPWSPQTAGSAIVIANGAKVPLVIDEVSLAPAAPDATPIPMD